MTNRLDALPATMSCAMCGYPIGMEDNTTLSFPFDKVFFHARCYPAHLMSHPLPEDGTTVRCDRCEELGAYCGHRLPEDGDTDDDRP